MSHRASLELEQNAGVRTMPCTDSRFPHDTGVSTVTSSSRLRLEHVVVVALVVAMPELVGTEGHARMGDPAAKSNKVCRPDETVHGLPTRIGSRIGSQNTWGTWNFWLNSTGPLW